jgi:hypothetical protein
VTQFVIERHPVTIGLRDMLRTFLLGKGSSARDLRIESGESPRDLLYDDKNRLVDPYAIIYPVQSLNLYGDYANPQSSATLSYQITSVGRTDDSAGIMSDLVRRGVTERAASSTFVRSISAGASMTVTDRRIRELGMMFPDAGLYNVHDIFDLEVQAHA